MAFIFCSSWIVGRLLGLNRLKVYLAANVSNPIVAPAARVRRTADRSVASHRVVPRADARDREDDHAVAVRRGSPGRQRRRRRRARRRSADWRPTSRCGGGARDPFFDRLARAAADRYVSDEHHGMGVRARKVARRSVVSRRAARRMAAFGRQAARHRMRPGSDAGASRRGRAARAQRIGAARQAPSAFRAHGRRRVAAASRTACASGARSGCRDHRIRRPDQSRRRRAASFFCSTCCT